MISVPAIASLAAISGCGVWQDVVFRARCKEKWRTTFLDLPHGISADNTFGRLFSRPDSDALERCLLVWMRGLVDHALHVIAIANRIDALD